MHVKVRVRANARREEFEKLSEVSFKVAVREKALKNAANRRVVELVAAHFKLPRSSVRIVRGQRSPAKLLSVG